MCDFKGGEGIEVWGSYQSASLVLSICMITSYYCPIVSGPWEDVKLKTSDLNFYAFMNKVLTPDLFFLLK